MNTMLKAVWGLISCGGYNSEVDEDVINVAKLIRDKRPIFYTDIAKELNLKPTHVELIQYILCSLDFAEYGTSPRGCWLTEKGEKALTQMEEVIEEIEEENQPNEDRR